MLNRVVSRSSCTEHFLVKMIGENYQICS